jgi:hypothetical protein
MAKNRLGASPVFGLKARAREAQGFSPVTIIQKAKAALVARAESFEDRIFEAPTRRPSDRSRYPRQFDAGDSNR